MLETVCNLAEAKSHINMATVDGLRKIKAIDYGRASLTIDPRDELGRIMSIEDSKPDIPNNMKEKACECGLVFSPSKELVKREQVMVQLLVS